MKTFLVFVTSADGKITKWGDPFVRAWSSNEDQEYFSSLMKNSKLVVLGSNTFKADPIKPRDGRLMIVLTSKPENYKNLEVPGKLEFTAEDPRILVEKYKSRGYSEMLIAGGPQVASSFLKEHLVDEIWLTIEPLLFGTGGSFTNDQRFDIKLNLISLEKINEKGTFIIKYAVLKDHKLPS